MSASQARMALAGVVLAGMGFAGGLLVGAHLAHGGVYGHDYELIGQTVAANDAMQARCHGWAGLELKGDGSSEVVGHCPPVTP